MLSAIILPVLTVLGAASITTGQAVIDKNHAQNAADLSVISARATYTSALEANASKKEAFEKSKETLQSIYSLNKDRLDKNNTTYYDFSKTKDGEFSITQSGSTELAIKSDLLNQTTLDYTIKAIVQDVLRPITPNNPHAKTAIEVSFVIDTSSSMGRNLRGSGDWIYEAIMTTAIDTLNTLFQGEINRTDVAVGIIHFHDDVVVDQQLVNNKPTARNSMIWPWHGGYAGATNIYKALEGSIAQIDAYEGFENKDFDKIKEVIIFLTDGGQSTKFGYTVPQSQALCDNFKASAVDDVHERLIFGIYAINDKNEDAENTLGSQFVKDCSSGEGYNFNVDHSKNLKKAFKDIADELLKNKVEYSYQGIRITK